MNRPFRESAALERHLQEESRCFAIVARELRTEQGMTENAVAKRPNVSPPWLQRLEANQLGRNFSVRHLFRVIDALGFTAFEFYKRVGEVAGPDFWLEKGGPK